MSPRRQIFEFTAQEEAEFEAIEAGAVDQDYLGQDLTEVLAGEYVRPQPDLLKRSDGKALLYSGKRHWVQGEPESGKSWLALFACAEVLWRSRRVVYFDWESDVGEIVGRLRLLGVPDKKIQGNFRYISPPGPYGHEANAESRIRMLALQTQEFWYDYSSPEGPSHAELVVIDACAEAMTVEGLDENSNRDVELWWQTVPTLALSAGAAVLVIDHVTKDAEGRGRWARGAGHKLGLTDVAYTVEVLKGAEFAPGSVGKAQLTATKDRPGGIRAFAVGKKQAGLMIVDATAEDEHVDIVIHPNVSEEVRQEREAAEAALAWDSFVATAPSEPLSKSDTVRALGGGAAGERLLDQALADGRLRKVEGGRWDRFSLDGSVPGDDEADDPPIGG